MTTSPGAAPRPVRAFWRTFAIVVITILFGALLALELALIWPNRARYALRLRWIRRWSRAMCGCLALRVRLHGPLPASGALLLPNHQGYIDIPALAAHVPALFVPKSEIAAWPAVGLLLRIAGHIYVDRRRGRALAGTIVQVESALRHGATVCVFLEGTSTGGDRVLPFKPSLLEPALRVGVPLVPVAIHYAPDRPGVDVTQDVAYWTDEHTLGPHLWRLLGLGGVTATITFGSPIAPQPDENRRALAQRIHAEVEQLGGYD